MIHHWIIYMYTFPNGKRYIGATRRPLHHRQGSKESGWAKYKLCTPLWEAIQEFGVDNIEQSILFEGDIEDEAASEMERFYIAHFKTNCRKYHDPSFGYNQGDGGEGTQERHLTEERREELRESVRVIGKARIGTHPSEETRHRQRLAKLGTKRGPMSEETKRKIGLANSLEMISDEERQRRSDSKKQPVVAHNPVTGETLFFDSGEQAADYFGVRPSAVSRWIKDNSNPRNGYRLSKAAGQERHTA